MAARTAGQDEQLDGGRRRRAEGGSCEQGGWGGGQTATREPLRGQAEPGAGRLLQTTHSLRLR